MPQQGHIHIFSCGIENSLHAHIIDHLAKATHIFASKALLELYAAHIDPTKQHCHCVAAKAREDASLALQLCREGEQVLILASGDALYNGIGGTLAALRRHEAMTFHPNITAFQALFHKLALPWSEVKLFSVHVKAHIPVRRIASEPFSLTYGGSTYPASSIAKALIDFHPKAKNTLAVLAQRLGSHEESIHIDRLEVLAQKSCHATSILLILPTKYLVYIQDALLHESLAKVSHIPPQLPLGLEEDFYERENNLITAPDVRAIILARLRLPLWGTLWDLGAGSGSVGLEAAALCPHMQVLALEQKKHRIDHMKANAAKMGVQNYHVQHTETMNFLNKLNPDTQAQDALWCPDRIFIGGGGAQITQIITRSLALLPPEGLLVVSAVSLESFHTISACAPEHRLSLSSVQIAHEQSIAGKYHNLKNQNTIYIFTFSPKKQSRERK